MCLLWQDPASYHVDSLEHTQQDSLLGFYLHSEDQPILSLTLNKSFSWDVSSHFCVWLNCHFCSCTFFSSCGKGLHIRSNSENLISFQFSLGIILFHVWIHPSSRSHMLMWDEHFLWKTEKDWLKAVLAGVYNQKWSLTEEEMLLGAALEWDIESSVLSLLFMSLYRQGGKLALVMWFYQDVLPHLRSKSNQDKWPWAQSQN